MRLIDAEALAETMYHEAFETDSDMQKWDSGCWIRYKMFEKHLANAPTIPQWIPCSERLPNTYGEYLITVQSCPNKRRVSTTGYFDIVKKEFGTFRSSGIWEKWDVIAWMPLPESYLGGE